MRLLLDECVDERLRHVFDGHDCETARYARMAGLKNGALLAAAESAGFDVLITADQHIPDQQSFQGRKLALSVLVGRTSRLVDLQDLAPMALTAIARIKPGSVVVVRSR